MGLIVSQKMTHRTDRTHTQIGLGKHDWIHCAPIACFCSDDCFKSCGYNCSKTHTSILCSGLLVLSHFCRKENLSSQLTEPQVTVQQSFTIAKRMCTSQSISRSSERDRANKYFSSAPVLSQMQKPIECICMCCLLCVNVILFWQGSLGSSKNNDVFGRGDHRFAGSSKRSTQRKKMKLGLQSGGLSLFISDLFLHVHDLMSLILKDLLTMCL